MVLTMYYYFKKTYRSFLRTASKILFALFARLSELALLFILALYYYMETIILSVTPDFLRQKKSLEGKVVLVTGGAGGVGQELVVRLARKGAKVIVWDSNEKAIKNLKEETEKDYSQIYFYHVDVTDRNLVYKYALIAKDEVGEVDILINNAGIVCGQTFLDIPDYMIEKTFKVNILSHYWTTKAFLPSMMRKKDGHIVTISSLTGLLGTYKCTDYSASKFATVGFHESLRCELKAHGHHFIKTTIVCPYFIDTGMFDGCKPRNAPMLQPKEVARRIITSIQREEVFVTIPSISRFLAPIKYFVPAKLGWELMHRVVKGPQSMMDLRPFEQVEAA